jgi:predicted glycosyltransferase involved in capsule biosynthesis
MQRFAGNRTVSRKEMVFNCPFQTSTLLFRRECYENLGGMDEDPRLRSGQDYEYFVRLLNAYRIDRIPEVLAQYRVVGPESLSTRNLQERNARGWRLLEVFQEKGLLRAEEIGHRRAALYYEEAKDNMFHLDAPFRRPLWRSIRTGCAPKEAVAMFALSFLPGPALRTLLLGIRGAINRRRVPR